jgi:hypothetical protein
MGRALLGLLCTAALLAACETEDRSPPRVLTDAGEQLVAHDPHGALPCTACHTGGLTGSRVAAVPPATCAAGGCHTERGPAYVSTGTAAFPHRDHGHGGEIALSCAGCHTHDEGRQPLRVSVDACALCHLADLAGSQPDDCRLCHQQPQHVSLTSQGLPIPHSALPWVETGCVRCHYDVAEPSTRVSLGRCSSCHGRDTDIIARGIATNLHPAHVSVTCTACHEAGVHRVRAMSSAVQLVCGDCHVREHDLTLGLDWQQDATCAACHEAVHRPQQQLLLGLLPAAQASPSIKFIAGMTCRSCHVRTADRAAAASAAIRGQATACASCHPTEYRAVLDWWIDGTHARTDEVSAYVARAARELPGTAPDSARRLIAESGALLELVRQAGGQHNLEASDRIFRESVDRVRVAYALAGRAAPTPPALGSPAHAGTCSYCHYSPDAPWDYRRMPGPFHRSVMGVDR